MKKRFLATLLLLVAVVGRAVADEGMWLLPMLDKLNIKDMKEKGLKLTAKDIYNINNGSLKDAIIIFGGGCTGEIVSSEGLIFTNHHCGYGAIQQLSSVEHDYLRDGYWAMNNQEELPANGLSAKFIRKIEDVTEIVLSGVNNDMSETDRDKKVAENIEKLNNKLVKKNKGKSILIKDFFGGNQFFSFVIEQFDDVRLVGTPPSSIGKFGGETDNWMWPRHTGDFSVFRIYADKDGKPAKYSKDNVPYKTPTHLPISLKGTKEGDFAMIMGFPGSTSRYMTSFEIDRKLEIENPIRIYVRGVRQEILKQDMAASQEVRIKYASKFAGSSNYWKNSIGMSRGLRRLNVKQQKQDIETRFNQWANENPNRKRYTTALNLIESSIKEGNQEYKNIQYIREAMLTPMEIATASTLLAKYTDSIPAKDVEKIKAIAHGFYGDYNEATDRRVMAAMLKIVVDSMDKGDRPSIIDDIIVERMSGDIDRYVGALYEGSIFANEQKFLKFMDNPDMDKLKSDPALKLRESIINYYTETSKKYAASSARFDEGHRLFIDGYTQMETNKVHYPDANFTLRLTYGNVMPYKAADAVHYDFKTTLTGVMEKEDATNPVEFTVPEKLKELYKAKDFGQYAENGDITVGFISNNDITGGNSGSPVLNGKGELIGLAFDGNWEAMSGDIAFEPNLQRTINVDIRYVMFIIDKFGGASWLLDEMTISK